MFGGWGGGGGWVGRGLGGWSQTCCIMREMQIENSFHLNTAQPTGGHFACACVNPLNDNSLGASNLMAGNRKLARKVTVLLKAISLVL